MTETSEPSPLLERLVRRSAAMLRLERWRRAGAAVAGLGFAFLAVSLAGVWLDAAPWFRIAGVVAFGAAILFAVLNVLLRRGPSRPAALARLDAAVSGLRPAASLDDALDASAAPETRALWAAHRRRLEAALAQTRVAPPDPRIEERDPYALRALAMIAAVAAAIAAGGDAGPRLAAAFDWRVKSMGGGAARVDAWLDPPAYTGRPPIMIGAADSTATAPVQSVLHVRAPRAGAAASGALEPLPVETPAAGARAGEDIEERFRLAGGAHVDLQDGRSVDLAAIPDKPPTIELDGPPRANARGSLSLAYKTADDYGVVSAEAVFSRPDAPRALYAPPQMPLTLPRSRDGLGEGKATLDLADSPFAGAKAALTLVAHDEAGNEGRSAASEVTLPQRRFSQPLARALVELRRDLALDPDHQRIRVHTALQALSLAPDLFETSSGVYLGLRAARRGLEGRRSDDDLRGVAELLWTLAVGLEDGDQSQAERDLRAAQENLRAAMARGADEAEIEQRSKELRAAMDRFLQSLAERAQRDPRQSRAPASEGGGKSVSEQDLQKLLDDIDKAMKSGDTARAQELLDQLQDIMENIRPSAQGGGDENRRKMSQALSDLDRLAREEQQLRDETFRNPGDAGKPGARSRGGAKPGAPQEGGDDGAGEQGGSGAPGAASSARERQRALRERLENQQKQMGEAGGAGSEELDAARRAMKEAEDALKPGGGGKGEAVEAQGRAVDALRRGADKLAEDMRNDGQNGGQQAGEGEDGQQPGRSRQRAQGGGETDPLGRSGRKGGDNAGAKYDPLGLPPALRAHKVQEELRRRLGQPERPPEELDYLQRLLKR